MDNDVNKKIKVTHISKFAYPHKGGIESFIEMFNTCIKSKNVNIEVLCCSNTKKSDFDENGVFYDRAKYLFELAANTFSLEFIWKLSKVKTDIIIYHMPFIFAVIAHFIARPKYKKMIVCYHSDIIGYDKIMKPFWSIYNKFLKLADIIHVQSPQMIENSMVKNFKEKAVVIPYLIDTKVTYNKENVLRIKEEYNNKKIIFAIGRHVKYKGFEYLLEAMKSVDNAVLLLGGTGPLTKTFKDFISKNNLQDKVELLGKIDDKELDDYYEACDIFVLPSIMKSETFAVVQLEAMKHGKPIINTNLGTGVNYVSIHGETGLSIAPRNGEQLARAISKLLNDNEFRLTLGQKAHQRVKNIFDLNNNYLLYRGLYNEKI